MIVNAAIFTCSICGEASHNICSFCTKDACSNHRCERCKRCSDCCECEYPLSAEEPAGEPIAPAEALEPVTELESPVIESALAIEPAEALPYIPIASPMESPAAPFLTPAEASVFAEEPVLIDRGVLAERNVFVESPEADADSDSTELDYPAKPDA
jgi:hypothetical protein